MIGRSHECDFPEAIQHAPVLTSAINAMESSRQMHEAVVSSMASGEGLYSIDTKLLTQLAPDVILTQSLCSVCLVDSNLVAKVECLGGRDSNRTFSFCYMTRHT